MKWLLGEIDLQLEGNTDGGTDLTQDQIQNGTGYWSPIPADGWGTMPDSVFSRVVLCF